MTLALPAGGLFGFSQLLLLLVAAGGADCGGSPASVRSGGSAHNVRRRPGWAAQRVDVFAETLNVCFSVASRARLRDRCGYAVR